MTTGEPRGYEYSQGREGSEARQSFRQSTLQMPPIHIPALFKSRSVSEYTQHSMTVFNYSTVQGTLRRPREVSSRTCILQLFPGYSPARRNISWADKTGDCRPGVKALTAPRRGFLCGTAPRRSGTRGRNCSMSPGSRGRRVGSHPGSPRAPTDHARREEPPFPLRDERWKKSRDQERQ